MQHRPQSSIIKLNLRLLMFDLENQYLVQCSLQSQTKLQVLQLKRFVDGETLYIQNLLYNKKSIYCVSRIFNQEPCLKNQRIIFNIQRKLIDLNYILIYQDQLLQIKKEVQCQQQPQQISELTEGLKIRCKSVKLTQLVELQQEIKKQQNEIMCLKQIEQVAIKVKDQDLFNDPETGKRIKNYILTIQCSRVPS
ncbi:unnamed protein product [Paramecium pentaurelia]|uniref:Uncharacterized protein n=1 Tax=Paramecium pentaurelia TaxID=43138 RepID=A0A8S1X9R7_9CILI|nr:unnamed protein product [Paramecium pentaurelia]